MSFILQQISANVWSILEQDNRGCNPYSYLLLGTELALLVDTGCGCGNIYFYIRGLDFIKDKNIIVVNTHNHPEQTGGNWRFSTTGKCGLAHQVSNLCASKKHKYYTKLMNSSWHWEIGTYKVTRWLADEEFIYLGSKDDPVNVVQIQTCSYRQSEIETHGVIIIFYVFWTSGHTPDSLVVWYPHDKRLFLGDLFYRFEDLMFTYEYTDIREYEASVRRILRLIKDQTEPKSIRYSASKKEPDNQCLPVLKHYHRFLLAVLAGTHAGTSLRIDDAEGWRYETRDKNMRIVLGRKIVHALNEAREKAQFR